MLMWFPGTYFSHTDLEHLKFTKVITSTVQDVVIQCLLFSISSTTSVLAVDVATECPLVVSLLYWFDLSNSNSASRSV